MRFVRPLLVMLAMTSAAFAATPSLTMSSPTNGSTYKTKFTVVGRASTYVDHITCFMVFVDNYPISQTWNVPAVSNTKNPVNYNSEFKLGVGKHKVMLRVYDSANTHVDRTVYITIN